MNLTEVIPISHFSPHSFIIQFENMKGSRYVHLFKYLYEKLFVSSSLHRLFDFIRIHHKELGDRDCEQVKLDLIRTRWNHDNITVDENSSDVIQMLKFKDEQLPTSLQTLDHRFLTNNVSDLWLVYYFTSGFGQKCVHKNMYEKLKSLTLNFNAYDRILCDVLEQHGLQNSFKGYWNLGDMYHLRGNLLRDGLVSGYPPDISNAVYYASPRVTFVVLQKDPITWMYVWRPFQMTLWLFLLSTFAGVALLRFLYEYGLKRELFTEIGTKYTNLLHIIKEILWITFSAAYGGMILVGILYPQYPWTPNTFANLNNTDNYFVGSAEFSPFFIMDRLLKQYKLNNVNQNMIKNRIMCSPADYLLYAASKEFNDIKEYHNKYYAAIMYDDKMNLWLKGRHIVSKTAGLLGRIKPAADRVLPEIRFVSVAPGATRLHFLMVTLKRVFTSGTWLRYHYLEQNYYKNVVPVLITKTEKKFRSIQIKLDERRLSIYDTIAVFIILGVGLSAAFFIQIFQLYTGRILGNLMVGLIDGLLSVVITLNFIKTYLRRHMFGVYGLEI